MGKTGKKRRRAVQRKWAQRRRQRKKKSRYVRVTRSVSINDQILRRRSVKRSRGNTRGASASFVSLDESDCQAVHDHKVEYRVIQSAGEPPTAGTGRSPGFLAQLTWPTG